MAKSQTAQGVKVGRNPSPGQYVSVGRTSDGVTVLRPSKPAKHFTARQARGAVIALLETADRK